MSNDPLIKQYEAFAYPRPITDMAQYFKAGGRDYSDPASMRRKLWPRRVEPDRLNILVAGCGANQAALLAYCNPKCRVTGIDLSDIALHNQESLKRRHALTNLTLQKRAVEAVETLSGDKFDLIL